MERTLDRENEVEHYDALDTGGNEVTELLPFICAVKLRGFKKFRTDGLSGAREKHHVLSHISPNRHECQRNVYYVSLSQPSGKGFLIAPQSAQDGVKRSAALEEENEHECWDTFR